MAYPDQSVVQAWLNVLNGLNVRAKKMFGCYCIYCDGQPVGWLSEHAFSLREVGLPDLPDDLKRPSPEDPIQEIVIPLDAYGQSWLLKAVQDTAAARKAEQK